MQVVLVEEGIPARQGYPVIGEDAVLTANGKPLAIMLPVTAETFDEALDLVHRMRALRAIRDIRLRAAQTGANKLTMAQSRDDDVRIQNKTGQ